MVYDEGIYVRVDQYEFFASFKYIVVENISNLALVGDDGSVSLCDQTLEGWYKILDDIQFPTEVEERIWGCFYATKFSLFEQNSNNIHTFASLKVASKENLDQIQYDDLNFFVDSINNR